MMNYIFELFHSYDFEIGRHSLPIPLHSDLRTMLPCTDRISPPIDVCERIIDHASLKTVRACSRVCRAWVPRSRSRLFYNVVLTSRRTASNFISVLRDSPHFSLGRYVHILSIEDYFPYASERNSSGSIYDVLAFLPKCLVNLHTLAFYSINFEVLVPLFYHLASGFTTIRSLRLMSLDTCSFRDTIEWINGFDNLEELEIYSCDFDYSDWNRRFIDSSRSHKLKFLRFDYDGGAHFSHWVATSNSYESLSTLELPTKEYTDELNDLLQRSSKTVQTLRLSLDWSNSDLRSEFLHTFDIVLIS